MSVDVCVAVLVGSGVCVGICVAVGGGTVVEVGGATVGEDCGVAQAAKGTHTTKQRAQRLITCISTTMREGRNIYTTL